MIFMFLLLVIAVALIIGFVLYVMNKAGWNLPAENFAFVAIIASLSMLALSFFGMVYNKLSAEDYAASIVLDSTDYALTSGEVQVRVDKKHVEHFPKYVLENRFESSENDYIINVPVNKIEKTPASENLLFVEISYSKGSKWLIAHETYVTSQLFLNDSASIPLN